MTGVLTPFGVLTLAQAVPALAVLDSFARVSDAQAKAELRGKLNGLASVSAALTVPPLPTARAEAAAKVAIQIALNPQFAAPSLQISANAKIAAEIGAKLSAVVPSFPLGTAGIAAYNYRGDVGDLGSKVSATLGGGLPGGTASDQCYAVLLVGTAPAAIAALASVLVS